MKSRTVASTEEYRLSEAEEIAAKNYAKFSIVDKVYRPTTIAIAASFSAGTVLFLTLENDPKINVLLLLVWYVAFAVISIVNILLYGAYKYYKPNLQQIDKWYHAYFITIGLMGIAWGSPALLIISSDVAYLSLTMLFLLAVGACFLQGTVGITRMSIMTVIVTLLPITIVCFFIDNAVLRKIGYFDIFYMSFLIGSGIINGRAVWDAVFFRYRFSEINKKLDQKVKERTKALAYEATHDRLTRLPNQQLLYKHLELILPTAKQQKFSIGIICLSINQIDEINDSLGHQTGNQLISAVAKRLETAFKKTEEQNGKALNFFLSILRQDVFVILIHPVKEEELAEKANYINSILYEPFDLEGRAPFKLTAYMGGCVYPQDGKDPETLLMNADSAMNNAKKVSGKNIAFYNAEIRERIAENLAIATDLHTAIDQNYQQFSINYQPLLDVHINRIVGMEALLRWQNPAKGNVSPAKFIPVAEATGLIIPLGEWVLYTACKQLKSWHNQGFTDLKVSVNLSAKQVYQEDLLNKIDAVLTKLNLEPKYLELELTESAIYGSDLLSVIESLKARGISLAIDDFGTGYSNFCYLKQLPVDKLKIDKSFIQDLDTPSDIALLESMVSIAKAYQVTTVVEGVETQKQLDIVKKLGCDIIQGYYFSSPLPTEKFTELLRISQKQVTNVG